MNVTGRPAQFGRGVMAEVGGKLVEQFAQNLRQLIADDAGSGGSNPAAGDAASAGQATATAETGETGPGSTQPSATIPAAAATPAAAMPAAAGQPAPAGDDSLNLVKLVGPAILKRAIPVVIALGGLAVLGRLLFRRRPKED